VLAGQGERFDPAATTLPNIESAPETLVAGATGMTNLQRIRRIERVIESIRPQLQMDKGDVELVDVLGDCVYVNMTGACAGCRTRSSVPCISSTATGWWVAARRNCRRNPMPGRRAVSSFATRSRRGCRWRLPARYSRSCAIFPAGSTTTCASRAGRCRCRNRRLMPAAGRTRLQGEGDGALRHGAG